MKKTVLFFMTTMMILGIFFSCKFEGAQYESDSAQEKFIPVESFYFLNGNTIHRTYFGSKYLYSSSYPGTTPEEVYTYFLVQEEYQKEYIKKNLKLKDPFLTSLVYNSLFAEYKDGAIEEIEAGYIVTNNVFKIYIKGDSLMTLRLDTNATPRELIQKEEGLYIQR